MKFFLTLFLILASSIAFAQSTWNGTNAPVPVTVKAGASGVIVNSSSITGTASTFTPPANAIGFILEADSSNTANIRWAIGSTASSSVGSLFEPGRDSGYVPVSANISVVSVTGTQSVSIQWLVK